MDLGLRWATGSVVCAPICFVILLFLYDYIPDFLIGGAYGWYNFLAVYGVLLALVLLFYLKGLAPLLSRLPLNKAGKIGIGVLVGIMVVAEIGFLILLPFISFMTWSFPLSGRAFSASDCRSFQFLYTVERCNGRNHSFLRPDYTFAMTGKSAYTLTEFQTSTSGWYEKCFRPSDYTVIACSDVGLKSARACYFCAEQYKTFDTDFHLLAFHKDRQNLTYFTSTNYDFRKEEQHPKNLGQYFDSSLHID